MLLQKEKKNLNIRSQYSHVSKHFFFTEGVGMAEKSIAKMGVKPVVTSDIVKQQKELEEQRRKIREQQDEVKSLNCLNLL